VKKLFSHFEKKKLILTYVPIGGGSLECSNMTDMDNTSTTTSNGKLEDSRASSDIDF